MDRKENREMKKKKEGLGMRNLDGKVGRERPGERIVVGSTLSGGAFGGVEKHGAHLKSAIDEKRLIGIGREGIEKPLEREMKGERREFRKGEKCFEEMVDMVEVLESRVLRRAGAFGRR